MSRDSILASGKPGYDGLNALHAAICVERNPRAQVGAVAQSVLVVADGDLLRGEDAADRVSGVLGVSMARTSPPVAISEVDG